MIDRQTRQTDRQTDRQNSNSKLYFYKDERQTDRDAYLHASSCHITGTKFDRDLFTVVK